MILKEKILFSKEECKSIILSKTNNTTDWNLTDRKYDSHQIKYDENAKWIFDKLKIFFETETNLKIIKLKQQIHLHKFIKGDWFGKHNDIRENRLYAVGVLLNDDFEGGDFKIYNPNEYLLNKETGNTYIFDVKTEHEITPILNGVRYSLLWFLQMEHIKIETNKFI
jgi:hypothetical protein